MNIGKCGIGQFEGKIECYDPNEAFQTEAVKNEPCENYIFTKRISNSSSSETCSEDYKHANDSYLSYHEQEQNEEKLVNNLKPDDLSSTCDSVQMKIEDVDIFYEDIKRETDEEKSRCQKLNESIFYIIAGQDMTHDEKPFSLDPTSDRSQVTTNNATSSIKNINSRVPQGSILGPTLFKVYINDSRLQPLAVQDETITGGEGAKEDDSSAIAQRLSLPPEEIDNKIKRKFSSKPLGNNLSVSEKIINHRSCSKSFSHMTKLKIHERVHTGEKSFHCKICSKSFNQSCNLRSHERIHTGEKPFHCKICSKSFNQSSILRTHEKIHSGEKSFCCKICLKSFIQKGTLRKHERIHTGEKSFCCKICLKSFIQKSTLRKHERIHTGERPFQCRICSKSFNESSNLRNHERIHTGEKSFHCQICSKSFRENGALRNHERSHTGEKPFHCKICSKSFSQSCSLRTHEKIHTGEKSFCCKICLKSFSRKGNLRTHERRHTGEKPFRCKICSKSFTNSSGLRVHGKIHTGQK